MLGVDTETLGKKYTNMTDQVVVMGLCPDESTRYLVPRKYVHHFKPVLENPRVPKALTFLNFDRHRLENAGIFLQGQFADTVVLDFLHDEDTRENRHGLKECVFDYFGIPMASYGELFGNEDITKILPGHEKWDQFLDYASLDPWASRKLALFLLEKLSNIRLWHDEDFTLKDHYWDIEEPQLCTLYGMERRGIRIDVERLQRVSESLQNEMDELAARLNELCGWPINPNSGPQIARLLFDEMGLEILSKTGTGRPTTDQAVLTHYARTGVEECDLILRYKKASKLKGTYCEGMLKHLYKDGHIHTTYSAVKVTGRLSSQKPNLQNIPRPSGDTHRIRAAFVPDPGYSMIVADYSQLEMRILASAADEKSMIEAIESGLDIHCYTSSVMFGIPYDEIYQKAKVEEDPEYVEKRAAGKAIGFGIVYGKTAYGLSEDLNISVEEAQELLDLFLDSFPGVRDYMEYCIHSLHENGYVQTIMGRFRRISKVHSGNWKERRHAERQGMNAPIQGSAVDIVKKAMVTIDNDAWLTKTMGLQLLIQIHDEFVMQVPTQNVEAVLPVIKEYMETAIPLQVSLKVSPKVVPSWYEGK